jgi:phage tail protein X
LRPSQLEIYELIHKTKRPHIECARQFGKTTTILDFVVEALNANPGWICRWCEPWKEQCHEIVIPAMNKLQENAPKHKTMRWREKGSRYIHPNGSILYLRGVNEDRGESSRGPHANIIVADEFGSWRNARYIVDEVLKPQLETTAGWFIFTSTPPEDMGHLYYLYADEAENDGRFIQKTIFDNESLSGERIEEIKRDCGGEQSMAWQRERLCKRIKNPDKVVVPEYTDEIVDLPSDYKRPEFFDWYVGGDNGVDDNTVLLFGYHDFMNDWVVIEDELVLNCQTTKVIAERAKEKEAALYGKGSTPYRRVLDADKQVLVDMVVTEKYSVYLPEKSDKHAAIRALRRRIQQGKLKIDRRCKVLRRQLRVGQWRDEKHQDFSRSEDNELKHLDAIAAAIYFNRTVVTTRNPYPANMGVSVSTHHIPEDLAGSEKTDEQALADMFRPF